MGRAAHDKASTGVQERVTCLMSSVSDGDASREPPATQPDRSTLQWFLYCGGVCLELLGVAFTGTIVVMFFSIADTRLLLSLTVVGMSFFYSGWFFVRHASRRKERR